MFGYMIRRFGFRIFVTQSIILRIMEEEFSKQSELLSALAGIREKLEAVHFDVLAVKKQHNMIEGDPILDFYDTCRMLHLSERQVRRLREEKKLIGFSFGVKRMYRYSEIKRYIDKIENQARQADLSRKQTDRSLKNSEHENR